MARLSAFGVMWPLVMPLRLLTETVWASVKIWEKLTYKLVFLLRILDYENKFFLIFLVIYKSIISQNSVELINTQCMLNRISI